MEYQFVVETLRNAGFKRLQERSFTISKTGSDHFEEQWSCGDVFFEMTKVNGNLNYRFFDKSEPNLKLGFHTQVQLLHMLDLIKQSKTVEDLFVIEQTNRKLYVDHMLELQKKRPFLEDYRDINIGGAFFVLNSAPNDKIHMTYEKYSTSAFYYSMICIADLEHSSDTVHTGTQTYTAIALWFLAFESYINTLIKLCCFKKNKSFKDYKRQDLHKRVGSLAQLLELDLKEFYKSNIIKKVQEFACFRNELFHDRYVSDALKFKYTNFSPTPIFSSQVDIMQAILIILETTSMLRYAIAGLDTMPSVILQNTNVAVWEKLDISYTKILQPWFAGVLKKHQLQTRLQLNNDNQMKFYSHIFRRNEVACMMTVDQEPKHEYWLNDQRTNLGAPLIENHLESYNLKPGTMRLNIVTLKT